jgi:hypothetical protein
MTMTAARLYEIVRDVPKDAWPKVWYDTHDRLWHEHWNDYTILPELAEAAFVGAMVRHQIDLGNIVWQRESDGVFCVGPWNSGEQVEAPTLIEALAAACTEAK